MTKDIQTSPKAAYKVVPGITAEDAAERGLVVVESNADGSAPLFGYYLNTVTGAAMETLKARSDLVPTPTGGEVVGGVPPGNKGALINPDDPIVHGTADNNPHADGAKPNDTQNAGLAGIVEGYSPGDALKPKKK